MLEYLNSECWLSDWIWLILCASYSPHLMMYLFTYFLQDIYHGYADTSLKAVRSKNE